MPKKFDRMNPIDNSRGCATEFRKSLTGCALCSCNKLNVYNWMRGIPETPMTLDVVEIRFKNTRKSFFRNINNLQLTEGDIVAVEASPGHDMGIVSLTGELVAEQMKKQGVSSNSELKNVYRKAKPTDIEKWESAIQREDEVMLRARKIALNLDLNMKIGDVEFQGDGTKAIFYYIADERIDFRQLIRDLADEFKIRVEMRQIGARQEAGRIGGIASCGRTLCCSSWMTDFISVTTNSARYQEISLNPQKLAGQCGKLKCCLNYEVESYKDAQKDFPTKSSLETEEGTAYYFKTDIYRRTIWYSFKEDTLSNITAVSVDRAKEILAMNKLGKKPQKLAESVIKEVVINGSEYQNGVGQESLTRFQNTSEKSKKKRKKHGNKDIQKDDTNQSAKTLNKKDSKNEIKTEIIKEIAVEKKDNVAKKIVLKKNKSENEQNNDTNTNQ